MAFRTSHGKPRVLVIAGPTASGKTAIGIDVARRIGGEIISADSRQVYRYMNIGTAKPTSAERDEILHHFIDIRSPDEQFNAGEFGILGRKLIEEVFDRKKIPVVVGGSGLYIQSLIDGFFDGPGADQEYRVHLYERIEKEGIEPLLHELESVDPVTAAKVLPSNERRIIRALEVYHVTGMPISELKKGGIEINFTPIQVGIRWERKQLYERIDKRVDSMIDRGLVREVENLLNSGYHETDGALQTVGYQEVFSFLRGDIDHDRMVGLIKQHSRQFAKRQMTWFGRDARIRWMDVMDEGDFPSVTGEYVRLLNGVA